MNDQSYVDLAEMMSVGSSREVNVIVQLDRVSGDSWALPRRLRVENGRLQQLQLLPELDMANPATMEDFARFCREYFPAANYMLVLWDHGNGWILNKKQPTSDTELASGGRTAPPVPFAVCIDQSSGNSLSVAEGELREALDRVRAALGKKLAILAFDACLMQMVEVMGEAQNAAEVMVGSEDLMPINGFPYAEFLRVLVDRPTLSAREYAALLPRRFTDSYSGGSQGDDIAVLSAVDLTRLQPALDALDRLLQRVSAEASSRFRAARDTVQTFACETSLPSRLNDNIDLIHLLKCVAPESDVRSAIAQLQGAVLAYASNDERVARARGVAVWFPDNYVALKVNLPAYRRLQFSSADDNRWLHFLNCFFGADEVKPEMVNVVSSTVRRNNAFRLSWNRAFDLSPVTYRVQEFSGPVAVLDDSAENFDRWLSDGFVLSRERVYSGEYAFYSGVGSNVKNRITLGSPVRLEDGGLLSFRASYNTLETVDTLGNFSRDICYVDVICGKSDWQTIDSLYGYHPDWHYCRYFLEGAGECRVRFRFHAGAGAHISGIFLDDIVIQSVSAARPIRTACADTFVDFFGIPQATFFYGVTATDSFGNVGYLSELSAVAITDYAEPYSLPSPIVLSQAEHAVLVCDYPAGETATVTIHTLSGELVKKFSAVTSDRLTWAGTNESGRMLASGIYLVVVRTKSCQRIGRIALVR